MQKQERFTTANFFPVAVKRSSLEKLCVFVGSSVKV
jgi:hypothetical protein